MKTFATALVAAGLLVAPSLAVAAEREEISVRVSTAGLNLSDPADLAKLRDRASRAIAMACNPGDRLNADIRPDWQCRDEMSVRAEAKVAAIANNGMSAVASY